MRREIKNVDLLDRSHAMPPHNPTQCTVTAYAEAGEMECTEAEDNRSAHQDV